ncbi:MAG: hypothetical protein SFX74_08315 [Fimbriimonadaceae bacterium]|nr:hypothetical protein [Fimbriimonadaceae bacterium]
MSRIAVVSVPATRTEWVAAFTNHPLVGEVRADDGPDSIRWQASDRWARELVPGDPTSECRGLVELVDNNPMVCADRFATPPPDCTLPLVAIGPLVQAGILQEPPLVVSTLSVEPTMLDAWLATVDWHDGAMVQHAEAPDADVRVTVMAAIQTPDDPEALDELFEERYGRSFFVRRDEQSDWMTPLDASLRDARYRLRWTPDDRTSLLTISLRSRPTGKVGTGQIVHAFNVMNGFEESLGVV